MAEMKENVHSPNTEKGGGRMIIEILGVTTIDHNNR